MVSGVGLSGPCRSHPTQNILQFYGSSLPGLCSLTSVIVVVFLKKKSFNSTLFLLGNKNQANNFRKIPMHQIIWWNNPLIIILCALHHFPPLPPPPLLQSIEIMFTLNYYQKPLDLHPSL